ncbi:MAG: Ig-like domain-containing protein [Bradymonadaceae bacterium]|nr:Ig-like domain-containing protein [Lujinxingiaceae bacterium]
MQRLHRVFLTVLLALAFVGHNTGCAENENTACKVSTDCGSDQICRDAVCVQPSQAICDRDEHCAGGYICVANKCARTQYADVAAEDTFTELDTTAPPIDVPAVEPDLGPDTDNPRVTAVSPANNATAVAANAVIEVTFNKSMNDFTINHLSFQLKDPDGREVTAASVTYDEATKVATFRPALALRPASRYQIIVTQGARDTADNSLFQRYEFHFHTGYEEPAKHRILARLYAPVVYQGVREITGTGPHTDIPTLVDFDGDMQASNNRQSSRVATANIRANIYYHVIESETHYFLHYILYYATRTFTGPPSIHEHDMTGLVVVVDKANSKVVIVEGIKVEDTSTDTLMSFRPNSSPVRSNSPALRLDSFPDDGMENGNKYPLFVPSGIHAACNWYVPGSAVPVRCAHDAEAFLDGPTKGVVLREGDVAQKYSDATLNEDSGLKEMTYKLAPFVDTFWLNRSDYSCGIYELPFVYVPENNPNAAARPVGEAPGEPLYLPNRLCTNDEISFGKTPFRWVKSGQASGGQWFLDPAYLMTTRFNFGEGNTFSLNYCHNIFFGVDRRDDVACQNE